jgi:ketosteroid isomerase-like protein
LLVKAKHLLLVAAVALALLLVRLLLVGPEERIRREMDSIAADASKTGPEKPIMAASRARSISARFTEDAQAVDLTTGQGAGGRDELARAIGWARESWDEGELFFEELDIELHGEDAAEARGRVRILDQDGAPASPYDGTRVRLEWAKVGGTWRILRGQAETPAP